MKRQSSARSSHSSSFRNHPAYAPSIGSRRDSNVSLVSNTVETAAYIARTSFRRSEVPGGGFKVSREKEEGSGRERDKRKRERERRKPRTMKILPVFFFYLLIISCTVPLNLEKEVVLYSIIILNITFAFLLCSDLQKRKVRKMHIMKGDSGLGLRIVGGKGSKFGDMGIFVNKLEEGGAAFK